MNPKTTDQSPYPFSPTDWNDRKIDDYFEHIAKDDKHDLAVELIIELGDKTYWDKISKEKKKKKNLKILELDDNKP